MKKLFYLILCFISIISCSSSNNPVSEGDNVKKDTYKNPIIRTSLPDPTVIKASDGYFYLYATEDIRNTPIYRSKNLTDWYFMGTAFTDATRPTFVKNGGLWAPDINIINGKYVLYYAMSTWGGEWECGIGAAVAENPGGPFTDHGKLFISKEINVQNSIDEFFIEDNGKKYLFWGSFHGIYGTELSNDGLSLKAGAPIVQIAGTMMEATYIYKHGKYYYLFGSTGTCCEGAKSTYKVIYGRSESLFGPYVTKNGEKMMDNHYEVLVHGNDSFAGTGHNAEFVTDDAGNDWILYHAFLKNDPDAGRVLMLDQIHWDNDWPSIKNSVPSSEAAKPTFNK